MDLEHTNSLNKHSMLEILPLQSRAVADKNNVPRLRVHSACSLDTTHQKTRTQSRCLATWEIAVVLGPKKIVRDHFHTFFVLIL